MTKLPPLKRPRKPLPAPPPPLVPSVVLIPDELYATFRGRGAR